MLYESRLDIMLVDCLSWWEHNTQQTDANRNHFHASLESSYDCRLVTTPQHIIISRMHFIMCSSYPGGFVYVSLHILTGHYSQSTQKIASYTLTNIIKANQSILAFVIAITFFFTKKMKKSTDSHYTLLALCLYCTDECVLCVQGRAQLIWRPMHACSFCTNIL